MRLTVCVALSLALMMMDHRHAHLDSLRQALSVLAYPLQFVVNLPVEAGEWLSESVTTHQTLVEENASLRAQNMLLNTRLQKLSALEMENMRLRELLDSSFKVADKVLVAELMAVDLEPFSREVVLNKGTLDSVYVGQPLLDANGVVGQIAEAGPLTSKAILITDPSHAIPVLVNRNGLRTVAVGTGATNELDLQFIPNNADIKVGDLLVTSGLGERFPPGYPVATVTRVAPDPSRPFAEVEAKPSAHLDSGREVLLVWPANRKLTEQAPADGAKSSAPPATDTGTAP
jgi:rod shape-determining protein MreC